MRFLAFLLTFLIGAFLATFVRAQECHKPSDTVALLDTFSKSMKTDAMAIYVDLPGENGQLGVLVVSFADDWTMGNMEMYQVNASGQLCRINNPSTGEPRTAFRITPQVKEMLDEAGTVMFDNRGHFPVPGQPS